jgi:hypothetical protein
LTNGTFVFDGHAVIVLVSTRGWHAQMLQKHVGDTQSASGTGLDWKNSLQTSAFSEQGLKSAQMR